MLELVNFRCLRIHCACLNLRILVGRFVKCQVVGRYAEGVPLSTNISVSGCKIKRNEQILLTAETLQFALRQASQDHGIASRLHVFHLGFLA